MNTDLVSRIVILVVVAAATGACGIPTSEFLGPPDPELIEFTFPATVRFFHNTADNSTENFLGYEVYYKFYQHSTDPLATEFGSDLAAVEAAAPGSETATVQGRGFFRIRQSSEGAAGETERRPLVKVDQSDSAVEFLVDLVFPDRASASDPLPASATTKLISTEDQLYDPVLLVRAREASIVQTELTFESDDISINPNDPDVPPDITTRSTPLHMAIVILAYGVDYTGNTFAPLYSDPIMVERPLEIVLQ